MRFEFSAGLLLYKKSRKGYLFLFLKRNDGFLDIPKGHIEKGEGAKDAAVRETREEAGIKKEKMKPFFRYDYWVWFSDSGMKIKKKISVFLANAGKSERVRISYEHVGYTWLCYEEAMKAKLFRQEKLLLKSALDYLTREAEIEKINRGYIGLPQFRRPWKLSRRFVKGEGPANAKIMIVGQAPGALEDQKGRPFVGRSGVLLEHLLRLAGLRRNEIYITSVVQFFPPKNRLPEREEVEACKGFLFRQIKAIRPRLIITLGNLSAATLLDGGNVMKSHGTITRKGGTVYFTTLHPAAAVRMKRNTPIIENDFRRLKGLTKDLGIL